MGLLSSSASAEVGIGDGGDGVAEAAAGSGGVLDPPLPPPACRARMEVAKEGAEILRPWSF